MSTLEKTLKEINKKYGEGTIRTANEFVKPVRIPTSIFSLDAEIGGGIPKGRICIFTGNAGTGKTTVAKKAMVQFQNTCKGCLNLISRCSCGEKLPHKAVLVDTEGSFDPLWFAALGGNGEDLLLLQPEFAEEAVDIVEALIRTGEIDIIVVDSVAMMSPSVEIDKSSEDVLVGTHARLINRMMRSIQAGMNSLGMSNECKPAVILVNQIRKNVGVMYGNPDTYPGGLGQLFASSITVKFTVRPSELIREDGKKDGDVAAIQIRFKVEKNKTFVPFRSGMFTLHVSNSALADKGSFNIEEQIVDYGVRYGLIEKSGAWFTSKVEIEGKAVGQLQGKEAMVNALIENPDLRWILSEHIMVEVLKESTAKDEGSYEGEI